VRGGPIPLAPWIKFAFSFFQAGPFILKTDSPKPASAPVPSPVLWRCLPAAIWAALILAASTDAGSSAHTARFLAFLLDWFHPHLTPGSVPATNVVLRKAGHFAEFFVLAALIWRIRNPLFRARVAEFDFRWARAALIAAALLAGASEGIQHFYPSRGASWADVLLNSFGAACALFAIYLFKGREKARPGHAEAACGG